MKIYIKIITLFITILYFNQSISQIVIKGGINLATQLIKDNDGKGSLDHAINTGFHFGFTTDIPINYMFIFEPGLIISSKGSKIQENIEDFFGYQALLKQRINLYYLDVPLNIKYLHYLDEEIKLFGSVGPYFGIGLHGRAKVTFENLDNGNKETAKENIEWGNDEYENEFKRPDVGISVGGGIELRTLLIGLYYDFGLIKINTYSDYGSIIKNRVIMITLGYKL